MKLATIVLGIAATAVAAPIQSSDTPVNSGLDRRDHQGGGLLGGTSDLLGGDIGSKVRRGEDLESTDSKLPGEDDRRRDLPLVGDVVKKLPVGGLLGSGGKVRRDESLESTDGKQIERREASPLGGELLTAAAPAVFGLVGGIGGGGGGAKVRRDENMESTVATDVEPTGEDAANVQKRQLPIQGDVVDKLLKVVSDTGLKRDGNIVSKEDGAI